jgi:hypothetical protein
MTNSEAFSMLEAHGIRPLEWNAGWPVIGCCMSFEFTSDRYPGRVLQLQFRELPPQAADEGSLNPQGGDLLNFWLVNNQATGTGTADPAVWKAAEHRMF